MASAWHVAETTMAITVLGWLLSPIIGLLLNKILSYLGFFDASQKLRELEIHTIPKLKLTLREVEEQRMLKEARKKSCDADTLDMLASRLKHCLYEAEDILDLRDYHRTEKKIQEKDRDGEPEPHNSSWLHWWVQHLDGAVGTCKRIWLGVSITRGRPAALLQWGQRLLCCLGRRMRSTLHISAPVLPISRASSVSVGQKLRCWSGPFDFNNCCRFIFNWLANAYEVARFYRNWSYHVVGITSYQEGGTTSDDAPPDMTKRALKKSLRKIERIINEAHEMLPLLNLPSHTNANKGPTAAANSRGPVTIVARPPKVFGRDEDRDEIIAMLYEEEGDGQPTSNSGLCYSIIGIHGISGSGKSTLAQLVCVREKDKQEKKRGHFDLVMWVYVSQNFSVDTIFSEMFEGATGDSCHKFSNLNALQKKLEKELRGKRFLLVLDDVWYDKDVSRQQELQQILSPLRVGGAGSKILVTSRTEDALIDLRAVRCIPISDLDEKVFLNLFMYYALEFSMVDVQDRRKFETIGEDIAKKLKRSPLAVRTVGGQLRIRPKVDFWRSVRDRDLLNETMDALWWSYQLFDEQLRRCFAYCSMFPRRHRLDRDELVNLWVAEGFIKTTEAGERMEDIARGYFDDLVSTSFLLLGGNDLLGRNYYTVHDLLYDLAEKVAGSDCFRIENGWTGKVPPDVRYLFVMTRNRELITQEISKLENLRTLIIDSVVTEEDMEEIKSMFTGLKKLRILKVRIWTDQRQFTVPASIGQLKHIRYLSITTLISVDLILPSTFTKLYHMEVLEFGLGSKLVFYPGQDLSNLINLRHLLNFDTRNIPNIGWLTSLQTLPSFRVKKEPEYWLQQLKYLDKLRGSLAIEGLENVGSKEEALEANLAGKEHLTHLILEWESADRLRSCSADLQAEILDGLCPSMHLETLQLRNYNGSRYPDWMVGNENGPKHLQQLVLWGCSRWGAIPCRNEFFVHLRELSLILCRWDALPDNMEHLTSLKKLFIDGCKNIWSLPTLPQSLEKFELRDCRLKSLPDNMEHLTSLKKLSIHYCKNIRSLPILPQSLEKFRLVGCSDVFMRSCQTIEDPNWQKIQHIPNKYFGD